jgi:hypothetical protein
VIEKMTFHCEKFKTEIDICTCLNEKYCLCDAGQKYANKKKPSIADRVTHPALNGICGGFADLGDALSKQGFEYQYKTGDSDYFQTGLALYAHPDGRKRVLQRIAKGAEAHQTGRTVGLVYIGAKPDVWQEIDWKEYIEKENSVN